MTDRSAYPLISDPPGDHRLRARCARRLRLERIRPDLFGTQARIERYISSGEYDREFAGRRQARAQLHGESRTGGQKTGDRARHRRDLALELAGLSSERLGATHHRLRSRTWALQHPAWQAMAASKALPPTLDLAKAGRIIGRRRLLHHGSSSRALREATERNLRREGYRLAGVILLPPGVTFKSAVDLKAPERRKIAEQGYTIILSMGDQASDLDGGMPRRRSNCPIPCKLCRS